MLENIQIFGNFDTTHLLNNFEGAQLEQPVQQIRKSLLSIYSQNGPKGKHQLSNFPTVLEIFPSNALICSKNGSKLLVKASHPFQLNFLEFQVFYRILCNLFMPAIGHSSQQIKQNERKNMSFEYLETYSCIPQQATPTWEGLAQIRDHFLGQLISQLSLNRILLDKTINPQSPFETDCLSVPTKNQDQSSEAESEEEAELMDELKNKKISKNSVSHNSSLRNDTKNIPKNYGKAILSFIQKSPRSKRLVAQMGVSYSDFMMQVRRVKKKINSIEGLKRMWGYDNLDHKIKKCIRILSYQFMRKNCLQYIFHSKVQNYKTHIKYRQKLIEGIENPASFSNIKDY